jgi:hypothetical protein
VTDQQPTSGTRQERGAASENEERLPPEVQGDSEMDQDPSVVPSAGAPSIPMDQPDDPEGDPQHHP